MRRERLQLLKEKYENKSIIFHLKYMNLPYIYNIYVLHILFCSSVLLAVRPIRVSSTIIRKWSLVIW